MALRSTEKFRVSTCAVADEIARSVIRKYIDLGNNLTDDTPQIVIAGFVAIHDTSMDVISLAVGNKFNPVGDKIDDSVRDCHAEILARRAFKHWLIHEYNSLTSGGKSKYFETIQGTDGIIRLKSRSCVKWTLYVSSAPCGNACIRRWGESPKETFHETLGPFELFDDRPHPPFHPHAQAQGQTAMTFKGQSTIYSCSDKILRWNVVGVQGVSLSGLMESRILLDAIVIGRKFVRKHAHRAFCCRVSSKSIKTEIRKSIHHPSMLCTAVKLNDGGIESSVGAVFTDRVFWWNQVTANGEVLEGTSGKTASGTNSLLAPICIRKLNQHLPSPDDSVIELSSILAEQFKYL